MSQTCSRSLITDRGGGGKEVHELLGETGIARKQNIEKLINFRVRLAYNELVEKEKVLEQIVHSPHSSEILQNVLK